MSSPEQISNNRVNRMGPFYEKNRPAPRPTSSKDFSKIMNEDVAEIDNSDHIVDEDERSSSPFSLAASPVKSKPSKPSTFRFQEDPLPTSDIPPEKVTEELPNEQVASGSPPLKNPKAQKSSKSLIGEATKNTPDASTMKSSSPIQDEQNSGEAITEGGWNSDEEDISLTAENEEVASSETKGSSSLTDKSAVTKTNPPSVFDLPKPSETAKQTVRQALSRQENGPSALAEGETRLERKSSLKETETKSTKGIRSAVHDEKVEIASMAAPNQPVQFSVDKAQTEKTPLSATLKDLIAQVAKEIQVIKTGDKTETIVTLQHPPIMAGSTVTISAQTDAKREFNITFAGLTADGKVFLDDKLSDGSLRDALNQRGVVVNTMVTKTEPQVIISQETQETFARNQERQNQQQRQRQGQEFDEETT